jgi:peptidoglycan/LPS O-acetylase OafA/YrhL
MLDLYLDGTLPDGLTQMWSLGTEVAFYLTLPVLLWVVLSRRRSGAPGRSRLVPVLVLMLAVNVAWTLWFGRLWDTDDMMVQLWLPSYLTWFGTGIVLAACHVALHGGAPGVVLPAGVTRVVGQMGRLPGTCWTAALALYVVACTPVGGPYDLTPAALGEALTKNLLYAVIAGLVVLPGAFAPPEGRYVAAMSRPALRHVGHISYGIFCFHLVVLELVARWRDIELFRGRGLELFTLTLVLTLVVSEVVYRLVERPALRFKEERSGASGSTTSSAATVHTAST